MKTQTAKFPEADLVSGALAAGRKCYEQLAERLVSLWEQRFRFRQYEPWQDADSEDKRQPPVWELEAAIQAAIPGGHAGLLLLLAAMPPRILARGYGDPDVAESWFLGAAAKDFLARARVQGFFSKPCPRALRFPDLPMKCGPATWCDFERAEQELKDAEVFLDFAKRGGPSDPYLAKAEARAAAAKEQLAGMRAGTIPAFTGEQKRARVAEERRRRILDYVQVLKAAGEDASWVEIPSAPRHARETRS